MISPRETRLYLCAYKKILLDQALSAFFFYYSPIKRLNLVHSVRGVHYVVILDDDISGNDAYD